MDLIYIALAAFMVALTLGLVAACDRLMHGQEDAR